MPTARNRYQRANQVLAWCMDNWPIGRKVRLEWVDELWDDEEERYYEAETGREGRDLIITLSRRDNRTWKETADSVMHEYTHCIQWPVAGPHEDTHDHHPPAHWAQYGEIVDRYHHHHGCEDCSLYPVE